MLQTEKAIDCQSKLEGNLDDLNLFVEEVQNNVAKFSGPANNKEDIEEDLGRLKNLEIELLTTEDMIKNILEVRNESVTHLNKAELNEIDKKIEKIENNLNDQRNAITKAKCDFDFDLKKWEKFNQSRDDIKNDLNMVIEELEQSQIIRKSVHGGDLEDKAELLKTKETRFNELINQEKEIENMISLAKELNSNVPLEEMENLKKLWHEKKDKIEKEINQNRKDLEDHKCLQNKLIAFKEWMKNSNEVNKQIEDLPNNKEGLLKKQNLLEKMKDLKSSGNNLVKDLKNNLSIILSETAPDFKDEVCSEINQEIEKFNATFGNLDNSNYDVIETISELKKLEDKCDKIKENVYDMERKIEQSLQSPKDSITDKEKFEKELNRSIRITEQLLSEIKELKNESDNLNHDAKEEVISKLTQLETQLIQSHQQINDEMAKNKELLIQQSKLEDNLKQLAFIIEEVENNMSKYSIPTNNVKSTEEKLNKLKDLENDLKAAESMIIKLDEEKMNMQSSSEHDNIDKNIDEMKEKVNNLRNIFEESKENVKIEINKWNAFIDKKENIQEKLKNISKEVKDNHVLRKGVHGGDCKDKEKLVKENELRFNDLLKQEKDFEEIKKLAKKLKSEISLREVEELENMYQEEKMSLEKELIQNQKDLKDHLYLQEEVNLFKEWFKDIEAIKAKIEKTPDSKEGLKSKQNLFEKINSLRSPGENKIKDLKNLLNNVLNNTASDYKTQLTSELKNEFDKFQEIFRNIDINDDNFNDVMSKLEKLEEGCEDICGNIEDINIELEKCLNDPRNTIEEKEKLEKELGQFNRLIDQQRSQMKELMNESEKLNNETNEEVLMKLQNVERNLNNIQHQINEELSQNNKSKDKQLALEKKLDNLESFILQFEDHIAECSVPAENEIVVEENLKKIEKLKNQIPLAKNLLEEILKTKNQFNPPEQCLKSCDYTEQKFFGVEEEIINLEKTLEMSKHNWTTFNSDKEDLENWIDSINVEMSNIFEKNQGIHGGRFEDKEKVLDSHRNLLQDVINHEVEIKGLIDRSTPLSTTPNTDSPKRITNTLCKKYEKVLETLTNIVQENQIDLEKHENFEKEIDKFCSENYKILKDLNEKISNEPNNEDGLKKKAELYDEIKNRYNQRAKLLPELEKMKEDLLLHSSPKEFQKIEQIWDKVVDSFTRSFSKSHENQLKLLATVGSLEQTNSNFENLENRLNNLQSNREECIQQPISTIEDAEKILNDLKHLRYEVSDLQSSIDQISRKTNELPMIKYKVEKIQKQHKSLKENLDKDINQYENTNKELQNLSSSIQNLRTWLDHSLMVFKEQSILDNVDSDSLRRKHSKVKILQDDIASHKVNLSRLQSQIEPLMKITHDRALENSVEELSSDYKELHDQCQNSIDKYDALVKLVNKYENSRTSVLNWIDTSTQLLLKCSDFNMNNSQIRSKLLMIENIEKDLEMSGQLKFIEAVQHGEDLINELCGMGRNIIERQVNDLNSDWTEICRQINHLLNNLKSVTSRNEAFKETINNLSLWLDNMEHVGMTESSVVDHHCIKPLDNKTKSGQYDRVKTLLVEVERKKPDFEKLRNIALEMGNPLFDLENSQIQTRFNKLQNNLKEKVDKLEKQEADFDKIKQNMENIEKWIFQTSIKFINENIEQNDNNVSVDDDLDTVLEQNNRIIQSIMDKEPEVIQVREDALNLLNNLRSRSTEEVAQFQEDIDKMECNFNNLKTTSVNKKQNLLENLDKWKHYQRLLESTKHFLDNDFQRWMQEQDLSTTAISLENNNKTKELQEIEDMEQKIVNMKRNVEKAAHECDGIPPKLSNVLSRSQTPNLKFYKNSPIPSPMLRPSSDIPDNSYRTGQSSPKSEVSYKPKIIFEQLEDNLSKLSRQKKEVQDKYADWNTFNREKSAFKNWFDNEVVKYESTLQSSPNTTNIDKFQRNKIKNIQDEMLSKKPVLMNLMSRFEEISSSTASNKDSSLRNMFQEFGKMENEITKLLNREDKEVEADFTEDESKADLLEDIYVPKLSLNAERYMSPETSNRFIQTFSPNNVPTNANFSCQTPSTKKTQTIFEDSETEPSDCNRQCLKSSKKDQLFNIASKISEIRSELDKTKLPSDRGSSPVYLSSRRLRLPNQESVRRNIIPSPSRRANHSKDYSSMEHNNGHSHSVLEISSPSSLHNRDLDEYVPAKDKWHDLEVFLQSTPRISESIQRQHPNREFQVSYQSPSGRNGKKSRRSNIYEELKKLTKDSKDLRSMDRDLGD